MKVELNIDASNMSETIGDVFGGLSKTEKKGLAKEVMLKWLTEPYDAERLAHSQEAIRQLRDKKSYSGHYEHRDKTDTEIMKHYDFTDKVKNFVSTKETMIKTITTEVATYYKKEVTKMIEEDPQVQKMKEIAMEEIKENFPKYTHDALMFWFAQSMSGVMLQISNGVQQSSYNSELLGNIQTRLTQAGIM